MDPFGRFFAPQDDNSVDCALMAIQNLLQTDKVDRAQLNGAAKCVADLTGDSVANHTANGFWSTDTIVFALSKMGYVTDYVRTLQFSKNTIGYIVHMPNKSHYACVRRHYKDPLYLELVDSLEGIESMPIPKMLERAEDEDWNFISVNTKCI